MSKYAIGVDFGTESGRAVLVDVADGREIASYVHVYANGVIDEALPGTDISLDPDFALQDPNDYLEVFKQAIPAVLKNSGVDPQDVIGIGIGRQVAQASECPLAVEAQIVHIGRAGIARHRLENERPDEVQPGLGSVGDVQ